ncbi:MAG: molybdopterin-guanine dinucleotide biosynthesis protein B [Candidatus Thermoplasmatota archaeon]|nr:molybdopterin-guanine dinucleotide biosynthesis protein B [Candidatus Thermoplasmatota archaeon]
MIIGIYGFQDAGKTVLVERLVKALVGKGYRVASVKHTTHAVSVDSQGKDTWRHWKAGSDPVVFMSSIETAIIKHPRISEEEAVRLVLSEFDPDVLVIEGNKAGDYPKVRIGDVPVRPGTVLRDPPLRTLLAYVEKEVAVERVRKKLPGLYCGKCGLDCDELARAVVDGKRKFADCKELSDLKVEVLVGGRRLVTGKFVSEIVNSTVRGMLSSMRGYEPGEEVEIRLSAMKTKARKGKGKA